MQGRDIHLSSLAKSTQLSSYSVPGAIPPLDIISVLSEAHVSFVLVGSHALGGWMHKPRAAEDVDVAVSARDCKKAILAMLQAFPNLDPSAREGVIQLHDRNTGDVLIDVKAPSSRLHRALFRNTRKVNNGNGTHRIPSLEMALAMKFGEIVSCPEWPAKKYEDIHDFMYMAKKNSDIDFEKLRELGELIRSGDGSRIVRTVRRTRAGAKLKF